MVTGMTVPIPIPFQFGPGGWTFVLELHCYLTLKLATDLGRSFIGVPRNSSACLYFYLGMSRFHEIVVGWIFVVVTILEHVVPEIMLHPKKLKCRFSN